MIKEAAIKQLSSAGYLNAMCGVAQGDVTCMAEPHVLLFDFQVTSPVATQSSLCDNQLAGEMCALCAWL